MAFLIAHMHEKKAVLRTALIKRRDLIQNRDSQHRQIRQLLQASPDYQNAEVLLIYLSKPQEVDTWQLLRDATSAGKAVFAPVCGAAATLAFYRVRSENSLIQGSFGVYEPPADPANLLWEPLPSHTLCLVPGIAFDHSGHRLGYGKGYYDRFLQGKTLKTIGLCYDDTLRRRLPRGPFDRPVDRVLTPRGWIIPPSQGYA